AGYAQAQAGEEQAPAVRKRSADRSSLAAPIVYEPRRSELRSPSVKPLEFADERKGIGDRSTGVLLVISTLLGVASGGLLLFLNGQNGLLRGTGATQFGDTGMIFHCLIWGGILGLLVGLIMSIFYEKLPSTLPIYAAMLYMPVLMMLLMPLMCMGTELVIAIVSFILGLIGAAFALFIGYCFLCGG
ncbi:MAG: hypothetical protein IKU34_02970, partial [Clostridia bacterium]|nr:hypothetical protein [Clostridia bacterium]